MTRRIGIRTVAMSALAAATLTVGLTQLAPSADGASEDEQHLATPDGKRLPTHAATTATISVKDAKVESVNGDDRTITLVLGTEAGIGGKVQSATDPEHRIMREEGGRLISQMHPTRLAALPVASDARIRIGGKEGKLADLKAGMHVSLDLGPTANGLRIEVKGLAAELAS